MFSAFENAGKHMLIDFKNVQNLLLLNNKENSLKDICKQICAENNFTILGEMEYNFSPQGYSFVLLLSESHLSIHTFPEKQFISFDLYTCRQYETNKEYEMIFSNLKNILQASEEKSILKITDRFFL